VEQRRALNGRHQLEIEGHLIAGLDGNSGRKADAELIRERDRVSAGPRDERQDKSEVTAERVLSVRHGRQAHEDRDTEPKQPASQRQSREHSRFSFE
jgi:hypothetical protein